MLWLQIGFHQYKQHCSLLRPLPFNPSIDPAGARISGFALFVIIYPHLLKKAVYHTQPFFFLTFYTLLYCFWKCCYLMHFLWKSFPLFLSDPSDCRPGNPLRSLWNCFVLLSLTESAYVRALFFSSFRLLFFFSCFSKRFFRSIISCFI